MAKTTIASASRLGLGSLAGALLAGSAFAQPATPDISELLDPARVAASACGGLRYARNELFKPGVQLAALASPAAAVEASPGSPLPILDGLGPDRLQATTRSDEARALAAQGYAWLMGFNHRLAAEYFRAAQAADPGCAICYWGEAYALGPNINDAMHADAVRPAFQAMAMATLLIEGASPREQALIRALKTRYSMAADADRAALDQAYADAMLAAADAHPDDVELLVLAAEAVMNSQPWDYWEADGVTPRGRAGRLVALLETALAADPDHPHAIHLYIHTVEASSDPARAEPHADRLAALMPTAGHVVHMPAHIYYRVGRYQDSLATNIAAAEADEALFAEWQAAGEEGGLYRFGYYPHNVHFVLTSATMAGDAISAMAAAHKLAAVMSDEVTAEVAWVQAIRTAPFTATAQLGDVDTVMGLPDPGDAMPFVKGLWHYARGVALARAGDGEAAAGEAAAIEALALDPQLQLLVEQYVPAPDLLALAAHVVRARIAVAAGDFATAESRLLEAVALQATVPYMEPPYWHYPVVQTLAAVELMAGEPEAASRHFQDALVATPNNGWSLFGLMEAQRAMGDEAGAKVTADLLDQAWVGPRDLLRLERL
jgi:tetratricopeptide (TPR) repeat protein